MWKKAIDNLFFMPAVSHEGKLASETATVGLMWSDVPLI